MLLNYALVITKQKTIEVNNKLKLNVVEQKGDIKHLKEQYDKDDKNLIQEITKEYNITTVINTHDMNSVMEIGEKIVFLKNGLLEWEGTNKKIFKTANEAVTDFVYSSELFKRVRKMYLEDDVK